MWLLHVAGLLLGIALDPDPMESEMRLYARVAVLQSVQAPLPAPAPIEAPQPPPPPPAPTLARTRASSSPPPSLARVPAKTQAHLPPPAPAASTAAPRPAEPQPLPAGWSEGTNMEGKTYYYNKATQETRWTRPPAAPADATTTSPATSTAPKKPLPVSRRQTGTPVQEGVCSAELRSGDAESLMLCICALPDGGNRTVRTPSGTHILHLPTVCPKQVPIPLPDTSDLFAALPDEFASVLVPSPAPEGAAFDGQRQAPSRAFGQRAQVLVVVSDHGSGTTNLGRALNSHPCVLDIGEPFGDHLDYTLWTSSKVVECNGTDAPDAIFDAETGALLKKANPQLTLKIHNMTAGKPRAMRGTLANLTGDTPSLYENLQYNIAEYFVRIRNMACKELPAHICPPSDCTISLKMFPQFVDANTGGRRVREEIPSPCTVARNYLAMPAWRDALESFVQHPKVATIKVTRQEIHRQFSVFRRFSTPGATFDCSFPRAPSTFATVSNTYVDDAMNIEECWAGGPEGANRCLGRALALVGLSTDPMGHEGVRRFAGEIHYAAHDARASENCLTDPNATFVRDAGYDEVHILPHVNLSYFGLRPDDDAPRPAYDSRRSRRRV